MNGQLIHQEANTIINKYAPNNWTPKYKKQKLTELTGKTDNSEIIIGEFNIPLSIVNRITTQKISKYTENLNNTINQT
jgi:hypothetical protein